MSQELFINVMSAEVRAALMEDSSLIDLIVERRERASVIGNIYLGRVERVMKGMEAAFIDIGTSRRPCSRICAVTMISSRILFSAWPPASC